MLIRCYSYLERLILGEIWKGGDSWAGLGWIIVDLSRCRLKEGKKLPGGVDVMTKVFTSSRIQYLYTSIAAKVGHSKGGIAIASSKTLKFSFLHGFILRRFDWGYSLHACCVVCFLLFCVDRILPTFIVRSLPLPPRLTLSSSPGGTSIFLALTSTA